MTIPTPKQQLQFWFNYLQALQIASEAASPSTSTNLCTFANSTISSVLTTPDEQGTFLVKLNGQTPYTFNNAQLPQASTFESLLERVSTTPPIFVFAGFLESCVGDPYASMSLEDLTPSLLKNVFPDLTGDAAWIAFQSGLTSSIPSACYSLAQQQAATKILGTVGSTVGQLLQQLIKLG